MSKGRILGSFVWSCVRVRNEEGVPMTMVVLEKVIWS